MKKIMYGSLGFLSLLGFVGIFTEERLFLSYFAFLIDFEYFFKKTDEMMDSYMCASARNGFYLGMIIVAIITSINLFSKQPNEALVLGIICGWSIAIIVHALSISYFSIKESWFLQNDKE